MMPPAAGRADPLAPWRARCKSCRADILWATTEAHQAMPVDVKPTSAGNVTLTIMPGQPGRPDRLVAGVLTRGQAAGALDRGVRLYLSHFASCPDAGRHRARSKTRRWRRP